MDSFEADLDVPALGDKPFHAVFIRAPVVDTDLSSQRLYVRATKEQLEQIRELLVKMGETNLATVAEDGSPYASAKLAGTPLLARP